MLLEETSLASEESYQLFFEHNPQPMWIFDSGTLSFLAVNDAAVEVYGYSKEELLSLTIKDIRPAADVPALLDQLSKNGSERQQAACRHMKKGGAVIDVEIVSHPLTFEGRPARLVLVNDVTERRRAEAALREAERKYRAIFENAGEGIFQTTPDGKFITANQALARMLGYGSPEELMAADIEEDLYIDPRRRAEFKHLLEEKGSVLGFEVQHQRKDGSAIWLSESARAVRDDDGKILFYEGVSEDISERKRAEEALRETARSREESLALLDTILSSAPIGFAFHNRDLVFERINETLAVINGLPVEQHLGRTLRDVLPEMAAGIEPIFRRVLETGEPVLDIELTGETPADPGRQHYWLASFYPVHVEGGEVLGVGVIVIDITERKRAEERLQESERRFRQLAENINEVFWVVDPNKGEMLYVSPAFEEIWGRPCQSLYEHPDSFLESVHPDDQPQVMAANERQKLGERCEDEYRIVRPDGSTRWIHDRAFPIMDEAGRVSRLVGISEDITERKHAEEQLKRLVTAVEQTADSIVITDPGGKIEYVNPAFERITGYSEQEVVGRNPRFLKSGKTDKSVYQGLWETITNGEVWVGNFINRKKDGTQFEERATISPVRDLLGRVVNYIAVKQDITQQTQLEAQFRQAQKMEAVGRLAGGVAHDFNNLLTAITGYSDLTLRKLNQSDPLRKNIEEVKKAAERASSLTRQLLAFSRKQVMQPKVLDLNAIISDMNKMLPRLIGEDLKVNMRLAEDLGRIKADPGQIEQVIVNLVVNARDAMPQGGTLTVATSNVIMDEELARSYVSVQQGPHVLLAVSDTGCGMDAETQQHIFEPFFTTKEMGKGTGLGLSTVFGIVKQSQGGIWVSSEVGQGTTFKVYLPRVDAQADALEEKDAPKGVARGTETVLLVEDDDLVRSVARVTLELCGYEVLEAANGGEALLISKERECKVDLLLTDVVMPRMSGRTLVKEITDLCPKMKVLYMSGYTNDAVVSHGVFQEGVAFIQKPFTPEALSRKVREVLESAR